jgi:hypothetical protein
VFFPKPFLEGMQLPIFFEPLYGEDLSTIGLNCQHGTRFHSLAVQDNSTGTTQAGLATDMGSCQAQNIPQIMNEEQARLNFVGL